MGKDGTKMSKKNYLLKYLNDPKRFDRLVRRRRNIQAVIIDGVFYETSQDACDAMGWNYINFWRRRYRTSYKGKTIVIVPKPMTVREKRNSQRSTKQKRKI